MLLPVYVKAEVSTAGTGIIVYVYVGLSVDEPLAENFPKERVILQGMTTSIGNYTGETLWNIDVSPGTHYVVAGVRLESALGIPYIGLRAVRITVTIANKTYQSYYEPLDPARFCYVAFNVDRNGAISIISGGPVPPGSQPITPSGGSKTIGYGGDISEAVGVAVGAMMQVMVPIMMINMMMQMMSAMMQSMAAVFVR